MVPGAPLKAPPFCPNPDCPFHDAATASKDGWRWKRVGFYERKQAPHRVQRYRCVHCAREFSDQTFRPTYWLKCPELLLLIFRGLPGCSCYRQLGRELDTHHTTVARHANRLGRHCQLFHERLRPKGPIQEPLTFDGLRNFEYSQYHPSEFHMVIGQHSHYVYGFTHSELRRMGRMTKHQKRRREKLEAKYGRPDPNSIRKEVARVLGIVTAGSDAVELHSDEHKEYPRAIRRLRKDLRVTHHTISSRATRDHKNPLFSINLYDLITRHSLSEQKRETIAFAKVIAGAIAVMWVLVAWRNYVKHFSEKKQEGTPAMRLGVCAHRWRMQRMLKWRLFPSQIALPEPWREHYYREKPTRQLPKGRPHRLKYAV